MDLERTTHITTPDETVNQALAWANAALEAWVYAQKSDGTVADTAHRGINAALNMIGSWETGWSRYVSSRLGNIHEHVKMEFIAKYQAKRPG